jgi:hypothetical protein
MWGKSAAQDRVWAQMSGLAPSRAGKRLFVVLQAFIDDSYTSDGVYVLAGYISSAEAWANFSKHWEEMLPFGTLNKHGRYHFKMSEMGANDEGMSRLPGFFRIIEKNVLVALSCKINIA